MDIRKKSFTAFKAGHRYNWKFWRDSHIGLWFLEDYTGYVRTLERNWLAWQAMNAVTYYVDHERGRTRDSALNSAWFGEGANLKQSALDLALKYTEVLYA